jgi:hypothetical protein
MSLVQPQAEVNSEYQKDRDRRAQLICPTGVVHKFPSISLGKNISVLQKHKSCYVLFIPPQPKRGDRERHERGAGMRWT